MSQGCNFINTWRAANVRKRSESATTRPANSSLSPSPTTSTTSSSSHATNSTTNNNRRSDKERRASSSNDINETSSALLMPPNRFISGNHLSGGVSSDTICGDDGDYLTQGTNNNSHPHRHKLYTNSISNHFSDLNMIDPTENCISTDDDEELISPSDQHCQIMTTDELQSYNYHHNHSCPSDILDRESLKLEDECKSLEHEIKNLEDEVDQLERERFHPDVSRLLIDNVIKQRKCLRDLDVEIYRLGLELDPDKSSLDDYSRTNSTTFEDCCLAEAAHNEKSSNSNNLIPSNNIVNDHHEESPRRNGDDRPKSRLSTKLIPGQENTADILNAIPPSGSLQHKHYLNRVGTDTSNYSQQPTYDIHKHILPQQPPTTQLNTNDINQIHHAPSRYSSDEGGQFRYEGRSPNSTKHQQHRKEHHQHHHSHRHHHRHHSHSKSPKSDEVPTQGLTGVYVQVVDQRKFGESGSNEVINNDIHHYKQQYSAHQNHRSTSSDGSGGGGQRRPPIRPNYFNDELRTINHVNKLQDSTSTPSSGSPTH